MTDREIRRSSHEAPVDHLQRRRRPPPSDLGPKPQAPSRCRKPRGLETSANHEAAAVEERVATPPTPFGTRSGPPGPPLRRHKRMPPSCVVPCPQLPASLPARTRRADAAVTRMPIQGRNRHRRYATRALPDGASGSGGGRRGTQGEVRAEEGRATTLFTHR
jgi:hypothetical protein